MNVSFFTTCMGRLDDLERALPESIRAHDEDPAVEFVLLDYNSQDGLESWAESELAKDVKSGRVVYAKTTEPKHYRFGHSRNVAALLCKGEIICSLDADNITPKGFAEHLRQLARMVIKPIITCPRIIRHGSELRAGECSGRKAFLKHQFIDDLHGYDERFDGWGSDDGDITIRARKGGFEEVSWHKQYYRLVTESSKQMFTKDRDRTHSLVTNRAFRDGNAAHGVVAANVGTVWGKADLWVNWERQVTTGRQG